MILNVCKTGINAVSFSPVCCVLVFLTAHLSNFTKLLIRALLWLCHCSYISFHVWLLVFMLQQGRNEGGQGGHN